MCALLGLDVGYLTKIIKTCQCIQNIDHEALFDVIDELILGIYASEILMKWYCSFTMFWRSGWNVFDLAIVIIMFAGVGKSTKTTELFFLLQ